MVIFICHKCGEENFDPKSVMDDRADLSYGEIYVCPECESNQIGFVEKDRVSIKSEDLRVDVSNKIGERIIEVLQLKYNNKQECVDTAFGKKSPVGLGRLVFSIVAEFIGEDGKIEVDKDMCF